MNGPISDATARIGIQQEPLSIVLIRKATGRADHGDYLLHDACRRALHPKGGVRARRRVETLETPRPTVEAHHAITSRTTGSASSS